MEVSVATNFADFVAFTAANSPHALVMDLWRRLDLALHEYCGVLGIEINRRKRDPREKMEKAVSRDHALGPVVASRLRELRHWRKRAALEPISILPTHDPTPHA